MRALQSRLGGTLSFQGPEPDGRVPGPRREPAAVGRKRDGQHGVGVALERRRAAADGSSSERGLRAELDLDGALNGPVGGGEEGAEASGR